MKKLYELELTRRGVTPAQFLAYVRQMCKRHDIPFEMSARDFANGQPWGNDVYSDTHYTGGTPETRPCFAETCKQKPFDYQTYFKGFDGSVYNEIIEFQFDDENTGFGYFYTVSADGETLEDAAAVMRSAVNVHEIAIKRNEYSIERKGAELAETLRNIEHGWAGSYAGIHADILRHEIEAAKRENEEHRAAIEEARAELAKLTGEAEQAEEAEQTEEAQAAPADVEQTEAAQAEAQADPAPVGGYGAILCANGNVEVTETRGGVVVDWTRYTSMEEACSWIAWKVAQATGKSAADVEAVAVKAAPGVYEIKVTML